MPTETLTFDFGTTPEEVIRERLEPYPAQAARIHNGRLDLTASDLLTVLDALRSHFTNGTAEGAATRSAAYDLRVSILAALGIKEG